MSDLKPYCDNHTSFNRDCPQCLEIVRVPGRFPLKTMLTLGMQDKAAPVDDRSFLQNFLVNHNQIVIEHGAGGIGDAALLSGCVNALREEWPDRKIVVRVGPTALPFMKCFDFCDTLEASQKVHSDEPVHGALQANRGYHEEARCRLERPRWTRYAKNIGTSRFVMPKLREPVRLQTVNQKYADAVALCPFSTDKTREWPLSHWLLLEQMLIENGYKCVVIHATDDMTHRFVSDRCIGKPAEEILSVILNCKIVINSDSGLGHLGCLLQRPTIILGGGTDVSKIFGVYPTAHCLQGNMTCSNCCGDARLTTPRCQSVCSNLASIHPEQVLRLVNHIWLKETLCFDRSCLDAERLAVIRRELLRTKKLGHYNAEFGVFKGGGLAKIASHYAPKTKLILFDTFCGLPENDAHQDGWHKQGEFACTKKEVEDYLQNPNAVYVVGRFPDSLQTNNLLTGNECKYACVHIDADLLQSTNSALDYFCSRMAPGGVMIFDDYEWWATPGVTQALHSRFPSNRIERSAPHQAIIRF